MVLMSLVRYSDIRRLPFAMMAMERRRPLGVPIHEVAAELMASRPGMAAVGCGIPSNWVAASWLPRVENAVLTRPS